jgi:hypothetical protein
MLDADLAAMHGVTTGRLNDQVRRNRQHFPKDFAFVLTQQEFTNLKSQFATSSSAWGGRRTPPLAFTEHGAVMAASVFNTPIAVAASIEVVRLDELVPKYAEHDKKLVIVFEALRQLMMPPPSPTKSGRIGFRTPTSGSAP